MNDAAKTDAERMQEGAFRALSELHGNAFDGTCAEFVALVRGMAVADATELVRAALVAWLEALVVGAPDGASRVEPTGSACLPGDGDRPVRAGGDGEAKGPGDVVHEPQRDPAAPDPNGGEDGERRGSSSAPGVRGIRAEGGDPSVVGPPGVADPGGVDRGGERGPGGGNEGTPRTPAPGLNPRVGHMFGFSVVGRPTSLAGTLAAEAQDSRKEASHARVAGESRKPSGDNDGSATPTTSTSDSEPRAAPGDSAASSSPAGGGEEHQNAAPEAGRDTEFEREAIAWQRENGVGKPNDFIHIAAFARTIARHVRESREAARGELSPPGSQHGRQAR